MVRDSNSGHQLLLPPANWCPIFASRATQDGKLSADEIMRMQDLHAVTEGRDILKSVREVEGEVGDQMTPVPPGGGLSRTESN